MARNNQVTDRILLDTNILISGYAEPVSEEGQVLAVLRNRHETILLLSLPLEDQIRRVGRRVGGKDWAGLILSRFWQEFSIEYVVLPDQLLQVAQRLAPSIPREDLLIFLTALQGHATIFISGNREFVREAARQQQLFVCMTPSEFLTKYMAK